MHQHRIIVSLITMVALLFAVSAAVGQPQEPYVLGEVTLEAKQVAVGVGWTWGEGKLRYKGKEYAFKIKGLNVVALGVSKITAKGDVYNLEKVADFAGNYTAAQAGAAMIKGPAGLTMRNGKGVVINLKAMQTGAQLNLGADGMKITMK